MSIIQERRSRPYVQEMSEAERELARVANRCIGESLDRARAAQIAIVGEDGAMPPVQLPTQALRLIGEVLAALSERRAVTIVSAKREMTTMEAAHYLHVSRPFVIREIEAGRLPHRRVGTHRRVAFDDLHAYKQRMLSNQKDALRRLSENAAELGLDY